MSKIFLNRITDAAVVSAIVSKGSDQVSDVVGTYANGTVVKYGDDHSRATRVEITILGGVVHVHRDTLQAEGIFAAAARFSRVVVLLTGGRNAKLRIVADPSTSPFNPIYLFFDGNVKIGEGYGQDMDLRIASGLVGDNLGSIGNHVSQSVIDWIKRKLKE